MVNRIHSKFSLSKCIWCTYLFCFREFRVRAIFRPENMERIFSMKKKRTSQMFTLKKLDLMNFCCEINSQPNQANSKVVYFLVGKFSNFIHSRSHCNKEIWI